jgi:hypothetical protein
LPTAAVVGAGAVWPELMTVAVPPRSNEAMP